MAAAARLMAGMSGRAVDGLEGGDAAGHLKLRGGKRVEKVAESSEVAPSAQAACQSGNAADFTIAPTATHGAGACADLRVTRASGKQRAMSVRARDQVNPSRQPAFTVGWKWPRRADGRLTAKLPPKACIFRGDVAGLCRRLLSTQLKARSRPRADTRTANRSCRWWRLRQASLPTPSRKTPLPYLFSSTAT